jgi:hypothetical protein
MQPTDVVMNKLTEIFTIIKSMEEETPEVSAALMRGLSTSMRLIQQVAVRDEKDDLNVDDQINMVTAALGFNLEDMVMHIVQKNFPAGQSTTLDGAGKDPDQDTLDFITSDLDDYEKFLAEAKAKDSLSFLKEQL